MCKYCETLRSSGKSIRDSNPYLLMTNFPIFYEDDDIFPIENDGHHPVQYLRSYCDKYVLVTEFADPDGNVIVTPINACPMCGRILNPIDKSVLSDIVIGKIKVHSYERE